MKQDSPVRFLQIPRDAMSFDLPSDAVLTRRLAKEGHAPEVIAAELALPLNFVKWVVTHGRA